MKIFHKTFQDKILTFFEATDSFTDNFSNSIFSMINQSGAKANNMLVGEIENEYIINHGILDEFYLDTFNQIIQTHIEHDLNNRLGKFSKIEKNDILIRSSWLNVMKKNEFNPLHIHEENDLNFIYFLNDFDSALETSFGRNLKSRFFNMKTQEITNNESYKGCHVIIKDQELMNIIPQKNFGIIYDFDLLHQVYPFQENEKRLSFVMNININRLRGEREWNPEKFKWEYTHTPHEKDDVRNNI
jgi:hypothetical protein|tara:strand:- start:43 stop:774 length:732 start_codon:yes stop_codon:yes gene_type:complete